YLARFGQSAFNRKYGDYVERFMNMPAGAVWVSDHMQADVLVYPDGAPAAAREDLKNLFAFRAQGKPARPWITVWRDMRTSKWLGWLIHVEPPNTDHIMAAMYNAMTTWGIPRAIYIDNGKDYRSRDFTGGRRVHRLEADELRIGGMAGALGIKTFFALPYNAQSKPVERDFKNWHAWIDRALPGYTGSNTSEKPEKLRNEIASGSIITIHEFNEIAELYIDRIICGQSSKGKALQGRSPNEAFEQEFEGLRAIDADELKLWCMRSSSVQELRRNGWRDPDLGWFYYAEWMNGYKGQRVYMRRDPKKYQIGWFFLESTDEYVGQGILVAPTPGVAETDLEREQLAEALRRKKRANKLLKSMAQTGRPDDVMAQAVHRMAANKSREIGNNYIPAENEVVITRMAAVVKKAETANTGTYDEAPAPKGKIVLFRNSLDDND
ncbi:MAG: hypothetical protein EHM72_20435, partial [Calditrichaeota bacterium]